LTTENIPRQSKPIPVVGRPDWNSGKMNVPIERGVAAKSHEFQHFGLLEADKIRNGGVELSRPAPGFGKAAIAAASIAALDYCHGRVATRICQYLS
jgi:hypothetical protein